MPITYDRSCQVKPILVPIVKHHEVHFGEGFKYMLADLLFPADSTKDRRLVPAIKAVRAELGIGLKEAKDLCEALTPEMLGVVRATPQQMTQFYGAKPDPALEAGLAIHRHYEALDRTAFHQAAQRGNLDDCFLVTDPDE